MASVVVATFGKVLMVSSGVQCVQISAFTESSQKSQIVRGGGGEGGSPTLNEYLFPVPSGIHVYCKAKDLLTHSVQST